MATSEEHRTNRGARPLVGEAWLEHQLVGLSEDVQGALRETELRPWEAGQDRAEAVGAALDRIACLVLRVAPGHLPKGLDAFIAKHGRTAAERSRLFGFAEGLSEAKWRLDEHARRGR